MCTIPSTLLLVEQNSVDVRMPIFVHFSIDQDKHKGIMFNKYYKYTVFWY
jgi:hypothetical protein